MSNRICLYATEFKDLQGSSFGYRVADDYDKEYHNFAPKMITDDLALLQYAVETTEFSTFHDFLADNESGLSINDEWYDWEQVKHILQK